MNTDDSHPVASHSGGMAVIHPPLRRPSATRAKARRPQPFRAKEPWCQLSQTHALRISENPQVSLEERLFWLGLSRMDARGHAHFQTGELARLLKCRSSGSAGKALARLKERQLVHPASTNFCLLYPRDGFTKGAGQPHSPCARGDRYETEEPYLPRSPLTDRHIPVNPLTGEFLNSSGSEAG